MNVYKYFRELLGASTDTLHCLFARPENVCNEGSTQDHKIVIFVIHCYNYPITKNDKPFSFCSTNCSIKLNNDVHIYTYLLINQSPEILVSYLRIQAGIHDELLGFSIFSKDFLAVESSQLSLSHRIPVPVSAS